MGIDKIQANLNLKFKDPDLLRCALTHPSTELPYSYERLEFLGDAVLGMVIAEMLFKLFPHDKEGDLSKKHVSLVCKSTLVQISAKIGLGNYIFLSNSEEKTGGRKKPSNLENALESLIAAIFLDMGIEPAKKFIYKHWNHIAKSTKAAPTNPKNILQEMAQSQCLDLPQYQLTSKSGKDHEPEFKVVVKMGLKCGTGFATSKKMAEQNAAKDLLDKINVKQ